MQKEVLRECRKNLSFTLEPVSESSTNSKAASSGMWNAKREICRLQARNAELEVRCGDQKQEIALLKEKNARKNVRGKKMANDLKRIVGEHNQLVGDFNQLAEGYNECRRAAIEIEAKYDNQLTE